MGQGNVALPWPIVRRNRHRYETGVAVWLQHAKGVGQLLLIQVGAHEGFRGSGRGGGQQVQFASTGEPPQELGRQWASPPPSRIEGVSADRRVPQTPIFRRPLLYAPRGRQSALHRFFPRVGNWERKPRTTCSNRRQAGLACISAYTLTRLERVDRLVEPVRVLQHHGPAGLDLENLSSTATQPGTWLSNRA
jgi:hypothetical protein